MFVTQSKGEHIKYRIRYSKTVRWEQHLSLDLETLGTMTVGIYLCVQTYKNPSIQLTVFMHSLSFHSTTYKQFHNSDKEKKDFRRYTDRHNV